MVDFRLEASKGERIILGCPEVQDIREGREVWNEGTIMPTTTTTIMITVLPTTRTTSPSFFWDVQELQQPQVRLSRTSWMRKRIKGGYGGQ